MCARVAHLQFISKKEKKKLFTVFWRCPLSLHLCFVFFLSFVAHTGSVLFRVLTAPVSRFVSFWPMSRVHIYSNEIISNNLWNNNLISWLHSMCTTTRPWTNFANATYVCVCVCRTVHWLVCVCVCDRSPKTKILTNSLQFWCHQFLYVNNDTQSSVRFTRIVLKFSIYTFSLPREIKYLFCVSIRYGRFNPTRIGTCSVGIHTAHT